MFSVDGCKDISSALNHLNGVGVMSVPPYIFVVGSFLGEFFVIDTHVIREELGGNGNSAIISFGKVEHCVQWLLKCLHLSGVREGTMQEIIKVLISNDVTSDLKDDEPSNTFSNSAHKISKPEPDNVSENMEFAESANLAAAAKDELSHWNDLEQKHWGKHRLPYIPDMRNKLTNSEMLAIVYSNVEIYSRVPQACRKGAVFLINTKRIKDLNEVKSDLNGTFRKSIESKWKTVETEIGA